MIREELLKYFKGDELATDVFLSKYSLNKEETPDEMHQRLSKEFARIESKYNRTLDTMVELNRLSQYGKTRYVRLKNYPKQDMIKEYIYKLFKDFKYIVPGGSVMQGLGSERPVSLSNCFCISPPDDTIESIINTARDAAQIYKRRGGVGFDMSILRPRGAVVDNSANTSTGSVSFMELYSKVTETICQEGRRGALLLSIDVNHPDVFEFATIKNDLSKITGANISIRLNDDFLKAVKDDSDYILRYPCETKDNYLYESALVEELEDFCDCLDYNKLYNHEDCNRIVYVKRIKARELWDTIIEGAHQSAEPGIFNWDKMLSYDPTGVYDELKAVSTNPCGELGLAANDSCRLLCTNLYSLITKPFTSEASIDELTAYQIFYEAQVLADNLVDLEIEAVERILMKINPKYNPQTFNMPEGDFIYWIRQQTEEFKLWWNIREKGIQGRRTGTGITAYADMLASLGKPYGDKAFTEDLFRLKLQAELDATIDMSIMRGAFPLWDTYKEFYIDGKKNDKEILQGNNDWYNFILKEFPDQVERMCNYGRRNSGISTIAPTGSVSILTQTTSGIEPLFQPFYTRRKKCLSNEKPDFIDDNGVGFKEFIVIHPKFKEWYEINRQQISARIAKEEPERDIDWISIEDLTIDMLKVSFTYSPWYNQTANDISSDLRVETQALIQKYITSSISSTVNVPNNTTKETINNLYLKAFELDCKGITVYRDGSRSGVLISTDKKEFQSHNAPKRPKELKANLHLTKSKGQPYAVIVGLFEDKPYEIFVFNSFSNDIKECSGKIIKVKQGHYKFESTNLTIDNISEQGSTEAKMCALYTSMLLRHGADIHYVIKTAKKIDDNITSFVSAMCRVLNKYDTIIEELVCGKCGGKVVKEGGCSKCLDCGESKCG